MTRAMFNHPPCTSLLFLRWHQHRGSYSYYGYLKSCWESVLLKTKLVAGDKHHNQQRVSVIMRHLKKSTREERKLWWMPQLSCFQHHLVLWAHGPFLPHVLLMSPCIGNSIHWQVKEDGVSPTHLWFLAPIHHHRYWPHCSMSVCVIFVQKMT